MLIEIITMDIIWRKDDASKESTFTMLSVRVNQTPSPRSEVSQLKDKILRILDLGTVVLKIYLILSIRLEKKRTAGTTINTVIILLNTV